VLGKTVSLITQMAVPVCRPLVGPEMPNEPDGLRRSSVRSGHKIGHSPPREGGFAGRNSMRLVST
jgi:hypothetical protein